jgi:DNA-binding transcriptional ArsR family regulator
MARGSESYELACGFGLLSDATRLGILKMLTTGPKNLAALCKGLRAKQPTVSHHIGLLRLGRLVVGTRKGKSMIYACDAAAIKRLAVAIPKLTPRK